MARTVDFFQIYYEELQLERLYPFSIPYKNEDLTPWFENAVISDLVPKSNADLISVCSWRLAHKRGDVQMQLQGRELTEENILKDEYDVAVLTPRSPRHKPLLMASHWHGQAWDNAIKKLREFIRIPSELKHTVYENHFVARSEIYREYVSSCLNPAMEFMREHHVFFADSGYVNKKRNSPGEIELVRSKLGVNDWPIAPFILERLFSIWIDDKKFKIIIL